MVFVYVLVFFILAGLIYLSLPLWKRIGGSVVKHTDQSFNEKESEEVSRDGGVQQTTEQRRSTEETQGTP